MGSKNIKDLVFGYLAAHPNQTVLRATMASDLGFTEAQVSACITGNLKRIPELAAHVQVIDRGHAWLWNPGNKPPQVPSKALYEFLATTKDGTVLVQAEDGSVFKLVEL